MRLSPCHGSLEAIQRIIDKFQYEDILENTMRLYARNSLDRGFIFQQDNDSKHRSKHIQNWYSSRHMTLLDWPSQFPDFNIIERVWPELERRLVGRNARMQMKSSPNLRKNGRRSLSPSSKLFLTLCLVGAKLSLMPMGLPPSINM
ncbi:Transposable element Tc1 transposase [Araneus ventricosus]|uniref:Transposable element Tc1 transposase n=1 Tax=Araneus ventricosus TaxID=182803 RepID=A0A4Y2D157_ARAVE|nr:Transposable element Tc1 transposase [Araneus ventricosus]